jgi:serine/threonine protein kinase
MLNVSKYSPDYSQVINQGGFGDVYKCKENKNMVIKMTRKDEKQYNGECNQKIIKKLFQHKNLMNILGVDKNKYGDIYLIYMEYIDGLSLNEYCMNYFINDELIKISMEQILSGLKFLHHHKITHRDIKLDNIIINPITYNVKIIDFGLAHYGYPCKNIVGTSGFFAPEMIYSPENYDSKCDIWSLGCILYFMVCGYYPFYFNHNRECYIQQLKENVKIKYYKDIWKNDSFYFLCNHMLVYNYKKRWSAKKLLSKIDS